MTRKRDVLRDQLKTRLEFMSEIGADFFFRPEENSPGSAVIESLPDKTEALARLRERILACRQCRLAEGRTHAVPGEGNPAAELMFVGEAPGRDEDEQGRPFVGRAGQLLTKIIEAMTFKREDVYIANIIKCRPPDNRTPQRDEIEACKSHLLAQLATVRPRVIVALGKVSTDFFHPSSQAMGELRGTFVDFGGIPVMPTYHPSFLVRNEGNKEYKKRVWEDMQKVMALLGKK